MTSHSSRHHTPRSIKDRLDGLETAADASLRQLAGLHTLLQILTEKVDTAMSDAKTDIANLQADMSRLITKVGDVKQTVDMLRENHTNQGEALDAGDLQALAQLHTDFGTTLDTLDNALKPDTAGTGTTGTTGA